MRLPVGHPPGLPGTVFPPVRGTRALEYGVSPWRDRNNVFIALDLVMLIDENYASCIFFLNNRYREYMSIVGL